MEYLFTEVKGGVYALAIYDEMFQSYVNCYVIKNQEQLILIDAGKAEYLPVIREALAKLGHICEDVNLLIATHGHDDHVGGSAAFPNATKYIHVEDYELLTPEQQAIYIPMLPDDGQVGELFDCVHFGVHSKGSIALFHPQSKVLFCGDNISFFGEPLPDEGLIGIGSELRSSMFTYLNDFTMGKPKEYLAGLTKLHKFPAEFLCTGHGGVLQGKIPIFIGALIEELNDVIR